MFKLVEKFNKDIVKIGDRDICALPKDEAKWLVGALEEELREFGVAYDTCDFIGSVDALIDLMYFAMGGLSRMGIPAEASKAIFEAVHNANMEKVKGAKEGREVQSELDATKPEGWECPEGRISKVLSEYSGK